MKHFQNQLSAVLPARLAVTAFLLGVMAAASPVEGQQPATVKKKATEPVQHINPQVAAPKTQPATQAKTQTPQNTGVQTKTAGPSGQTPSKIQQLEAIGTLKTFPLYYIAGNQVQTAQIQPGASVKLKPSQSLMVAKTGNLPTAIRPDVPLRSELASKKFYALPETYYARLNTGKEATLNLVFGVERPLKRGGGQQIFDGALSVFLQDSDKPAEQQTLQQPVILEVAAPVDRIDPQRISLTHTNLPSTSISFQADHPADSVAVRLITSVHTEGYTAFLPVQPAIDFPGSGQILQGWGVEQIPVTIQLQGASQQQTYPVALEAYDGSVNPTSLTLRGGEPQTVYFRSRGLQGGVLRASNPLLGTAETRFAYRIPFAFLIAALLGGMVGGYFRFSGGDSAQGSAGRRFLSGLLGGILGAGAYSLGVNLLGDSFPTFPYFSEIVTFVVAALAGGALSYFAKGKA